MKLIVLGGAGDVGSRAVEDLAGSEGVTRVTIADRNLPAARAIAARLSGSKAEIEAVAVDANDHAGLVQALRGHDVAASALGPFYKFEQRLVRAAIEAGVDYASVCDEWQAAESVLDELGDRAREAGRLIVTGFGASPGVSNLGIRFLANRLDRVRRAEVSVYQPLDAGGGEAVLRHMLFIMSGNVAVWRDGERVEVPACSESRVVEFPRYGKIRLWNMGHAEPVTIPRYLEGIENVSFWMGYGKGARALVLPARAGLFSTPRRTEIAIRGALRLEALLGKGAEPGHGAVRLDVWGTRDGREQHHLLCGTGQMREVTGISLSVGAQMLGKLELTTTAPGVYAPEGCVSPELFIQRMRDKGLEAYEDIAMTRPLALAG